MSLPLRHATLQDVWWWVLRRYRRFRVTGQSMLPYLVPNQEVLIDPAAYMTRLPESGDIVVATHPRQKSLQIIKRVEFVEADGHCYLKGDNSAASSDSRQFGLVPQSLIVGKVVCFFP